MKIRRNYKRIIIGALILSAVFMVAPSVAQAVGLGDVFIGTFFTYGVKVIGWLIQGITALALTVVGYLLNLSLDINLKIVSTDASGELVNTIIGVGWKITRDVANLGFVLAIIIIAFATILRFQEYGAKKLLTRLIVMALLVNFSFVIAAGFINVSNVFTNFFIRDLVGGPLRSFDLAGDITAAFNPQRLLVGEEIGGGPIPPPLSVEDEAGGLATVTTALLVSVAGLFFSAAFLLILVITYGAMAIMFIIRYIALTFLIIISPIAWLLWAVPKMSGQFDKWWSEFLKWVFFAPIMSFFIYIALIAAKQLHFEKMTLTGGGGIFVGDVVRNVVMQGSQMVVLAGILLGGLMVANSMSIVGARASLGAAKAGVKGLGRGVGYRAERMAGGTRRWVGGKIAESEAGKAVGAWAKRTSEKADKTKFGRFTKATFRIAAKPFKEARQTMTKEGLDTPTTVAGFMFKGMRTGSGVWKTVKEKEKLNYGLMTEKELEGLIKKREITVKSDANRKELIDALEKYDDEKKKGGIEQETK